MSTAPQFTFLTSYGSKRNPRRGAMLVLVAVALVIVLVMVAFTVDVAYMQLTRTNLRTATDAAARAGAEALTRLQDEAAAHAAAIDAAGRNEVAGQPLQLADEDVIFGNASPNAQGAYVFNPGGTPVNGLRVLGRRTGDSPGGSVRLFLGGMLGVGFFEPTQTATAVRLDRDICIVADRSGSMAWDLSGVEWSYPTDEEYCDPPHPTLSRWAAVASAVQTFMAAVDTTDAVEQVGLVSYASGGNWCGSYSPASRIDRQLTTNSALVNAAVANITSKPIPGGTSISAGIDRGVVVLTNAATARPYAEKTMIVLTDGYHNDGRSPVDAAVDAAARGITLHTITFSSGANIALMQQVAAIGGGQHFHAPDAESLNDIFREIALTLPVLLTE